MEKNRSASDKSKALDALIRDTIDLLGPVDAADLPHRIRDRLQGQGLGEADLDDTVEKILREMARRTSSHRR